MSTDWKAVQDNAMENFGALAKGNPKLMSGMRAIEASCAALDALDAKTRELIALAVAASTRCDTCIALHAKAAVEAGASREELLETLAVAVGLNAGAAFVYASHILNAYDAMAK